jgi:uncharacterized membrane protein
MADQDSVARINTKTSLKTMRQRVIAMATDKIAALKMAVASVTLLSTSRATADRTAADGVLEEESCYGLQRKCGQVHT